MQTSLFPLKARSLTAAPFGTADLKAIARTHDGLDFAVKTCDVHIHLPASEFLCYRLAQACQVAVPFDAVIELPDGTLAFGSRWEYGASQWKDLADSTARQAMVDAARASMSAILALDLFLGNVDRHFGNFLFRENRAGEWTALAMDYSRALLVAGFPACGLPGAGTATLQAIGIMKAFGVWDGPSAVYSVSELHAVAPPALTAWLAGMPVTWLGEADRNAVLQWWDSPAKGARIAATLAAL